MTKKIKLIDADSKIPNLALMKLSTYYKDKGYTVDFEHFDMPYYPSKQKTLKYINSDGYDRVFCSVVFQGNKDWIFDNGNVEYGGTGVSLKKELPEEIEGTEPDYSLYPENKKSWGFISRGCIRNCPFCVVPEKEGMIRQVNNVSDIVRHKKTEFLDNNILALQNHLEILSELVEKKIRCRFNQGLDIRLLTADSSDLLSKMNYMGEYIFAFDDLSYMPVIKEKIKLLSWRKPWQIKMYIYINPEMDFVNITKRIDWMREKKILPYAMRDISCWDSTNHAFYTDVAAYCNQPNMFKKKTFADFLEIRHKDKNRINESTNIYEGRNHENANLFQEE